MRLTSRSITFLFALAVAPACAESPTGEAYENDIDSERLDATSLGFTSLAT